MVITGFDSSLVTTFVIFRDKSNPHNYESRQTQYVILKSTDLLNINIIIFIIVCQ
jgi:hypothetical protein